MTISPGSIYAIIIEFLSVTLMTDTIILTNPLFLEHDPGHDHVENPERLRAILSGLESSDLSGLRREEDFPAASFADLVRVHARSHIDRIAATAGSPFEILDPDTRTSARSYDAAILAAGAVIFGVDEILAGRAGNGFALVRPPGHHAEADRAMGFCLFNNIAVGAAHALAAGCDRVLVVDFDLHHGNGTQHAFYDDDRVLYFSIHQYPHYPGTGAMNEIGSGRGEGYTVNVPLGGGQGDAAYEAIFKSVLAPVARQFKPDIILVSAGYDICFQDPLGGMAVTPSGFRAMTRVLKGLAGELCGGRIMCSLEGGYSLEGLRDGVLATLAELASDEVSGDEVSENYELPEEMVPLAEALRPYWNLFR